MPRGDAVMTMKVKGTGKDAALLTNTWPTRAPNAKARIRTIGGRAVDLRRPAPSFH
jgi:hypothetical protein